MIYWYLPFIFRGSCVWMKRLSLWYWANWLDICKITLILVFSLGHPKCVFWFQSILETQYNGTNENQFDLRHVHDGHFYLFNFNGIVSKYIGHITGWAKVRIKMKPIHLSYYKPGLNQNINYIISSIDGECQIASNECIMHCINVSSVRLADQILLLRLKVCSWIW